MKPVLIWCSISAALICAALFFKHLQESTPAAVIMGALFLATAGFVRHISKA